MHAVRSRAQRQFALVIMALMVVLAGCNVQLNVTVDIEEDGSGTVIAGVGLDTDARARFPALDELLITSDLVAAGWEVSSAQLLADGREWVLAEKSFDNPDELQSVLDELFGADAAVLTDWELIRIGDRNKRAFDVVGSANLEAGLALFSDPELLVILDDPPLGTSIAEIEATLPEGMTIDDVVQAQVVVNLPGDGGRQVFEVPVGETTNIVATSQSENRVAQLLGWVRTALIVLFALSIVLAIVNWLLDRRYTKRLSERRPERMTDRVPGPTNAAGEEAPSGPRSAMQMIVLDGHDVLFAISSDPHERLIPFVREPGGETPDDEIIEYHRQATLGRLHAAAFWQAVGVEGDPSELDAQFLATVRLQSGAKEFLREMHRRGVPVAVVTNDLAEWSYRLRDLHGLSGVAPWIVSSDIGVRKPDPAAFEALRRLTGVPYHAVLTVDGQIPSLDMAATLGMMTAWFTPDGAGDGVETGHAVIAKFGDFFRRRRSTEPQRRRRSRT
jgi:putative hydrolase of the HAD superfamily